MQKDKGKPGFNTLDSRSVKCIALSLICHTLVILLLLLCITTFPAAKNVSITLIEGDGGDPGGADGFLQDDSSAKTKACESQNSNARENKERIENELLEQALTAVTSEKLDKKTHRDAAISNKERAEIFTAGGSKTYQWRNREGRSKGTEKYGGNAGSESSVELGLKWLIRHRDEDGKWSADSFARHCQGEKCRGKGVAKYTPALTGLALMCFLAAGYTPEKGKYARQLRATEKYLLASQNSAGFFGDEEMYGHAIILLALSESFAQTENLKAAGAIRRAVRATVLAQQPGGGWDYQPISEIARSDTSITGWQLLSLLSAKRLDFSVPAGVLERGFEHIARSTLETGEVRYADGGPRAYRKSDALVAVALLCAMLSGEVSEVQKRQLAILSEFPPDWSSVQTLDHSMYYWYHGTLAMFMIGGAPWKKWNTHLQSTLVRHQVKTGEAAGSWPPEGKWCGSAGRVYSTAINILNLEIYYRYRPSFMLLLSEEQLRYLRTLQKDQ